MGSFVARDLRASLNNGQTVSALGWGDGVSGKVALPRVAEKDFMTFSVTYGEGIGSGLNDQPPDAVYDDTGGWSLDPIPALGWFLSYEHWWNRKFTSTFVYGALNVDNRYAQTSDSLENTRYWESLSRNKRITSSFAKDARIGHTHQARKKSQTCPREVKKATLRSPGLYRDSGSCHATNAVLDRWTGFVVACCSSQAVLAGGLARLNEHVQAIVTVLSLVNPAICGMLFAHAETGRSRDSNGFLRDTMSRLMGFVVLSMGVQFALTGFRTFSP